MSYSGELERAMDATIAPKESRIALMIRQKEEIQHAMKSVMKEGEHYGTIPGTPKPSLWQPGADCLIFLFSFSANYEIITEKDRDDLISYDVRCTLRSIDTDKKIGEGLGACNSREKRYQAQSSAKVCPKCQKPTIIRGKKEYGGGWLCFAKKGGCGAKWSDGAEEIEEQEGQAQTAGVWDLKNTILKMACKRAKVAAVLTATAASDCFTQDLEDLQGMAVAYSPPPKADTQKGQPQTTVPSVDTTATTISSVGNVASSTTTGDVPHDPVTGEVYGPDSFGGGTSEYEDPNGFAAHVEIYERMVSSRERKEDPASAPQVICFKWDHRDRAFRERGTEPKLSQEQNRMIHALRADLGHHLDRRVNPPASHRFQVDGTPVKATIEREGKYYGKLRELFGKDSTDQLSVNEASDIISLLQGMLIKVKKNLDRYSTPVEVTTDEH